MKICVLALAALIGGASATGAADDIYAKYFSGVNDGKPCYARNYDDAHLKSHPKQKVRQIEVDFDQGWRSDESARNTAADFHAGMSFMLKTSPEWYGQQLYCKIGGNGFDCTLDADGGRIRLTPARRQRETGNNFTQRHRRRRREGCSRIRQARPRRSRFHPDARQPQDMRRRVEINFSSGASAMTAGHCGPWRPGSPRGYCG